jgi:hypothetical protein
MTATSSVDRVAASRLVAALKHAWSAIRFWHPTLPPPADQPSTGRGEPHGQGEGKALEAERPGDPNRG